MQICSEWITGFMVGIEFYSEESTVILDLGIIRILFVS